MDKFHVIQTGLLILEPFEDVDSIYGKLMDTRVKGMSTKIMCGLRPVCPHQLGVCIHMCIGDYEDRVISCRKELF